MGWVPIFYWPRFSGEIDDLEMPLRMIGFRTNNYFGQQVLSDWNGFKLLGLRRPDWIDIWNVDVDYLSARTKTFPALGSEIGWFGSDLIRDLSDPYHKVRNAEQSPTHDYFGYFDIWGLHDTGIDVLGSGPAIVTNGPPARARSATSGRASRRSRTSAAGSTCATCSGSSPTTRSTSTRTFGSSSRPRTAPTVTSSRSTTSG